MFTLDQLKSAHSKVKSGNDFPAYVQEIIRLGVVSYDKMVADGSVVYHGKDGYAVVQPPAYATIDIAESVDAARFQSDLKKHQEGRTDYMTFVRDAAAAGVERWTVSSRSMTCAYYDALGNILLEEKIPQP